ncbi:MAG: hypothetical protein O2894_10645 [Planctomycetota bacterium]|nr:hypothetical protein [Planctomycetota bacterium]
MGTFHHGKGDLHGITVVVDLNDTRVFVGRCDTVLPEGVVLLDADMHDEAATDAKSKADYLGQARKFGVWKKYDRVLVPTADVASVRPLADLD